MFKRICCFIAILSCCFVSLALAQEIQFPTIHASIDVPSDYELLLPETLPHKEAFLQAHQLDLLALQEDFASRGVLLQAWKGDTVLEVTALSDERSNAIFDVDAQDESTRGQFRVSFYPQNLYEDEGYIYQSSSWKNFGKDVGRFLVLQYAYAKDGENYTAFARKTIKNGHEITVALKALNRRLVNDDNVTLNKIFKSFKFTQTDDATQSKSSGVHITRIPPKETNVRTVEISGNANFGVEFRAAVMSLGAKDPTIIQAKATQKNKFQIPITFSKQGVYLVTLNAFLDGEEVGEWAYPITYREGLLSVEFSKEAPEVVYEDTYKIKGFAEPGSNIQVLVNGQTVGNQHANAKGEFAVTLNTSQEGNYEAVLVFSKKNLQSRRFKFSFMRAITLQDEPSMEDVFKNAITVNYAALRNSAGKYIGKNIRIPVYVQSIEPHQDGFLMHIAFAKRGNQFVYPAYLLATEDIGTFYINRRIQAVGEFLGLSDEITSVQGLNTEEHVPVFQFLGMNE